MAVSGWEGKGEAVGQPRRVPNRDATSYLAGSRLLSPAHVPQRMRQVQTLDPFQDLPTEGAIGRRPHHKPSLSVLRRRRLHRTRRVGWILDGAQNKRSHTICFQVSPALSVGTMDEEAGKDAAIEAEKQRLQMAAVLYRALRSAEDDLVNARPPTRAQLAEACHSKLQYDFPIVNAAELDALTEEMAAEIAEGTAPGSFTYPITSALVNAAVEGACKPAPGAGSAPGISGKSREADSDRDLEDAEEQHVRLAPPDGDGVTDTTTVVFNRTVRAEFLDGESKMLHSRVFAGQQAYCVQLLRLAFEPRCWRQLD